MEIQCIDDVKNLITAQVFTEECYDRESITKTTEFKSEQLHETSIYASAIKTGAEVTLFDESEFQDSTVKTEVEVCKLKTEDWDAFEVKSENFEINAFCNDYILTESGKLEKDEAKDPLSAEQSLNVSGNSTKGIEKDPLEITFNNVGLRKCLHCDFTCDMKVNLTKHEQIHSDEKSITCLVCGNCFKQERTLRTHMKTHSQEKKFKCQVCDYQSHYKSSLKRHLLTHTQERPFKCSHCVYQCNQKGTLLIHTRCHTQEKPYKCTICDYRCIQSSRLRTHFQTHVKKL